MTFKRVFIFLPLFFSGILACMQQRSGFTNRALQTRDPYCSAGLFELAQAVAGYGNGRCDATTIIKCYFECRDAQKALEKIDACLANLHKKPNYQEILQEFTEIKAKIERIRVQNNTLHTIIHDQSASIDKMRILVENGADLTILLHGVLLDDQDFIADVISCIERDIQKRQKALSETKLFHDRITENFALLLFSLEEYPENRKSLDAFAGLFEQFKQIQPQIQWQLNAQDLSEKIFHMLTASGYYAAEAAEKRRNYLAQRKLWEDAGSPQYKLAALLQKPMGTIKLAQIEALIAQGANLIGAMTDEEHGCANKQAIVNFAFVIHKEKHLLITKPDHDFCMDDDEDLHAFIAYLEKKKYLNPAGILDVLLTTIQEPEVADIISYDDIAFSPDDTIPKSTNAVAPKIVIRKLTFAEATAADEA